MQDYVIESIIEMYTKENLSAAKIGEEMGMSESTVRKVLTRHNIRKSEEQIHFSRIKNHTYEKLNDNTFIREDGKIMKKMTKEQIMNIYKIHNPKYQSANNKK